jgi:hypothetical protein
VAYTWPMVRRWVTSQSRPFGRVVWSFIYLRLSEVRTVVEREFRDGTLALDACIFSVGEALDQGSDGKDLQDEVLLTKRDGKDGIRRRRPLVLIV